MYQVDLPLLVVGEKKPDLSLISKLNGGFRLLLIYLYRDLEAMPLRTKVLSLSRALIIVSKVILGLLIYNIKIIIPAFIG